MIGSSSMIYNSDKPLHKLDGGNGVVLLSPVSAAEYDAMSPAQKAIVTHEIRKLNRKTLDKMKGSLPAYAVELQKIYKFVHEWQATEVDKFVRRVFPNLEGKSVEQCLDWLNRNRVVGQFIDYTKPQLGPQKLVYGIVCWETNPPTLRALQLNIELSMSNTGEPGFKAEAVEIPWPDNIIPSKPQ